MRTAKRTTAWFVAATLLVAPAPSRAGTWTGGATEWTQISNNIQLTLQLVQQVMMVVNLVKQVAMMIKMTKTFDSPREALAIMHGFHTMLGGAARAVFMGKAMAERWRKTHPGAQEPAAAGYGSISEAYDAIDRDLHAATEQSLRALDVHVDPNNQAQEEQIFAQLKAKAGRANGEMQAAQVANELLLEIVRQLNLLRQVVVIQARLTSVALSEEAQRRLYHSKHIERDYRYRGRYTGSAQPQPWVRP